MIQLLRGIILTVVILGASAIFDTPPKHLLPKWYCLGGKDPKTFGSAQAMMTEFIRGPCAPVIMVPGHQATKLRVVINCPALRMRQPTLFRDCGWTSCDGFWSPKAEYQIWVGDFNSPMSIFDVRGQSSKCFGGLMTLVFDASAKNPIDMFRDTEGVSIKPHGQTPETWNDTSCGGVGIGSIYDAPEAVCAACLGHKKMKEYLEYLGYQAGLTVQYIPFDWRRSVYTSDGVYKLKRSIKLLYELTEKKVVIQSHSLGTLIALSTLNGMTQSEKDLMVAAYLALSPPYDGSPKAMQAAMGGNPDYRILPHFGLHINGQRPIAKTHGSTSDLMPGYSFHLYAQTKWMDAIVRRAKAEQQHPPTTPSSRAFWSDFKTRDPFAFFPTPMETCAAGYRDRKPGCHMFMGDILQRTHIKIGNVTEGHSYQSLLSFLHTYSMTGSNLDKYMELRNKSRVPYLFNPGVATVVAYISHVPTGLTYHFKKNPRESTDKGNYAIADHIDNGNGDKVVPTSSSLVAALKWAWEYATPNSTDPQIKPKPVKIVEVCSTYNTKLHIWDAPGAFTKNEYMGARCGCMPKKPGDTISGKDCEHATVQNDHGFLQVLGMVLNTKESKPNAVFTKLSSGDLEHLSRRCPQLRAPAAATSFLKPTGGLDRTYF